MRSAFKRPFAKRPDGFVTDSPLQFTKRELRAMFFAPRFWAALAAVSAVLGMAGPFGTYESLRLLPRFAYWAGIVVATYFAGMATVFFLVRLVWGEREPGPGGFALAGAAGGLPVALVVFAINSQVFAGDLGRPLSFLVLLAYCSAIAATVSAVVTMFAGRDVQTMPAAAEEQDEQPARPPILERLPASRRGRLLYMSMQDHYVDVHTDTGHTLVLMRIADAVAETRGVDGLRIHRSHWVAREAVVAARRRDGRLHLEMEDGALLPVSRSHLAVVRKAGLADA